MTVGVGAVTGVVAPQRIHGQLKGRCHTLQRPQGQVLGAALQAVHVLLGDPQALTKLRLGEPPLPPELTDTPPYTHHQRPGHTRHMPEAAGPCAVNRPSGRVWIRQTSRDQWQIRYLSWYPPHRKPQVAAIGGRR